MRCVASIFGLFLTLSSSVSAVPRTITQLIPIWGFRYQVVTVQNTGINDQIVEVLYTVNGTGVSFDTTTTTSGNTLISHSLMSCASSTSCKGSQTLPPKGMMITGVVLVAEWTSSSSPTDGIYVTISARNAAGGSSGSIQASGFSEGSSGNYVPFLVQSGHAF